LGKSTHYQGESQNNSRDILVARTCHFGYNHSSFFRDDQGIGFISTIKKMIEPLICALIDNSSSNKRRDQ